jgi:hypothetical protein
VTSKMQSKVREAVRRIHERGEYPSRNRMKAEMHKTSLSAEVNLERLAEIRRLGLEVILAKAGWRE